MQKSFVIQQLRIFCVTRTNSNASNLLKRYRIHQTMKATRIEGHEPRITTVENCFELFMVYLSVVGFWKVVRLLKWVSKRGSLNVHCIFTHTKLSAMKFISRISEVSTSGSRGGPRGPGPPPWLPDLEARVIQFGGPVYNLRAKQWILGPFFYIFQKNF